MGQRIPENTLIYTGGPEWHYLTDLNHPCRCTVCGNWLFSHGLHQAYWNPTTHEMHCVPCHGATNMLECWTVDHPAFGRINILVERFRRISQEHQHGCMVDGNGRRMTAVAKLGEYPRGTSWKIVRATHNLTNLAKLLEDEADSE